LPRNIYLVGFVSYFDTDTWKRRILNSVKVPLNTATEVDDITNLNTCSLYPNPAANYAVLDFNLKSSDDVTVGLFDMSGKKVAELYHGNLKKGSYSLNINTGLINPGNYFCLIRTSSSVFNKRLIVIH
jgi:hypothetical protein